MRRLEEERGSDSFAHLKKLSGERFKAKFCLKKNYELWPSRLKE
jgi:hypothetical protein